MGLRKVLLLIFSLALTLRSFAFAALPLELGGANAAARDMTCLAAALVTHEDLNDAVPGDAYAATPHQHDGTCVHLCAMAAALPPADWPRPTTEGVMPVSALTQLDSFCAPPPLEPPRTRV